jgi:hypothetical protein
MCVLCCDAGDVEQGSTLFNATDRIMQQDAYLKVDIYRIEQVVRNLVTNAVSDCIQNGLSTMHFHISALTIRLSSPLRMGRWPLSAPPNCSTTITKTTSFHW